MIFSWLSRWVLNAKRSILTREKQREIRQAEGEEAVYPQRQRLERSIHKLRKASSQWSWKKQGRLPGTTPQSPEGVPPCWHLHLGPMNLSLEFWPPELWESKFLLLLVMKLEKICYSSLRKWICPSTVSGRWPLQVLRMKVLKRKKSQECHLWPLRACKPTSQVGHMTFCGTE